MGLEGCFIFQKSLRDKTNLQRLSENSTGDTEFGRNHFVPCQPVPRWVPSATWSICWYKCSLLLLGQLHELQNPIFLSWFYMWLLLNLLGRCLSFLILYKYWQFHLKKSFLFAWTDSSCQHGLHSKGNRHVTETWPCVSPRLLGLGMRWNHWRRECSLRSKDSGLILGMLS